jgi:hypothetical protein
MSSETNPLIDQLGSAVLPFERKGFRRKVKPGENVIFLRHILSLHSGQIPDQCLRCEEIDVEALRGDRKYLWIIDDTGIYIIWENTLNPQAERGCVCHTNITGNAKARQGGELWFDAGGTIYLNYESGRYGADTDDQKQAVLEYFAWLGFTVVRLPDRASS